MNEIGSISWRIVNWKHQLSSAANLCFKSQTLVKEPPSGNEWLHELKFDGYRMLCRIDHGKATFWSRNGKDWTSKCPAVAEAVKSMSLTSAIIDGEIVVVDAQGRSSFQKLQRAMGEGAKATFVFQVFDLIYLEGYDLAQTPLKDRKSALKPLLAFIRSTRSARGHR